MAFLGTRQQSGSLPLRKAVKRLLSTQFFSQQSLLSTNHLNVQVELLKKQMFGLEQVIPVREYLLKDLALKGELQPNTAVS